MRCSLKSQKLKQRGFRVRDGEKPTGFVPLVAYQIAESGGSDWRSPKV